MFTKFKKKYATFSYQNFPHTSVFVLTNFSNYNNITNSTF